MEFEKVHVDGYDADASNAYAINQRWAALADREILWIYDLSIHEDEPLHINHGLRHSYASLCIAISPAEHHVLGLAGGHQTFLYNARTGLKKGRLAGNGHNITAITFSHIDPDIIATGTANGSVSIWSIGNATRQLFRLHGIGSACHSLVFSPLETDTLVLSHGERLSLWSFKSCGDSLTLEGKHSPGLARWLTSNSRTLVHISMSGILEIWRIQTSDSNEDSPSGQWTDGIRPRENCFEQGDTSQPFTLFTHDLGYAVLQMELLGHDGMAVLPENGELVIFYKVSLEPVGCCEVWRLSMIPRARTICSRSQDGRLFLVACTSTGPRSYEVPRSIGESLGWSPQLQQHGVPKQAVRRKLESLSRWKDAMMTPEPIRQFDNGRSLYKTGRNPFIYPQYRQVRSYNRPGSRPSTALSIARTEIRDLPSMTSSLELPAIASEDERRLIPFLSPAIPASRELPPAIMSLDESIRLPPLARPSFDSTTSTTVDDSDSDDDALSGPLISSGTLLPGGVNVPLPRTCGAVFGPSGDLVVFLPWKPQPVSVVGEQPAVESTYDTNQKSEVTRLFPTFGNLNRLASQEEAISDSESSVSDDTFQVSAPRLGLQPASFDSRQNWNVKLLPVKTKVSLTNETKIKINVYNAQPYSLLRRDLAEQYRLGQDGDETHSDLCRFNADKATLAGFSEAAEIWTTLAFSLQRRDSYHSFLIQHQRNPSLALIRLNKISTDDSKMSSGFDLTRPFRTSHSSSQLSGSSLDQLWLAKSLIQWAEQRGDVQMLAHLSVAVLDALSRPIKNRHNWSTLGPGSPITVDAAEPEWHTFEGDSLGSSTLPLLRADSTDTSLMNSSFFKSRTSLDSSKLTSQPATPYLQSALSTPPFIFSSTSRRNTRLSASGSASPEHNRNSFSAAAKYYAQSITDKFVSYGSSPPTKRLGNSPSLDLPLSLPTTTDSWTKSVSFASVRNGRRGLGIDSDDAGFDSDRTVDENGQPHAPKSSNIGVRIHWHEGNAVDGLEQQSAKVNAALEELHMKSRIWCGYYADRLRSWSLLYEATELEKMIGDGKATTFKAERLEASVRPRAIVNEKQPSTCSICYCVIQAAQQVCPTCRHTSHPVCLTNYLESISATYFTCPTGCGCNCTLAQSDVFIDANTVKQSARSKNTKTIKKKASLTDPRRARARLEGESW